MFKCLVIAPYEGFKDIILDLKSSYPFQIDVQIGNIRRGDALLRLVEEHQYDVVICRGGTSRFFKKHLGIPVIEIEVTSYDILRTLTILRGYKGKIGMIGFENVLQNVKVISELLEIQVLQFSIESVEDIVPSLKEALDEGVEVIIGDALTSAIVESKGVQSIMIVSGKEAILSALQKAMNMYYFYQQKEKETENFLSLLSKLNHGIFIVNAENNIVFINKKTEKLLNLPKQSILDLPWKNWLQKWGLDDKTDQPLKGNHIIEWNNKLYILQKSHCSGESKLFVLHEADEIKNMERLIRRKLYSWPMKKEENIPLNQLIKNLQIKNADFKQIEQWNQMCKPILIYGESGTNKETLALSLHNNSKYSPGPFICFDTTSTPPDEVERKLFGTGTTNEVGLIEQAYEGTLYIERIDNLSFKTQAKLNEILNDQANPYLFRLVASNLKDLLPEMQKGNFHSGLYYTLQPQHISIPPLRERVDELDDIIRWILADANKRMNKQAAGIKPDVLKRLKLYHWPNNYTQLKQVLYKLIETSNSLFISMDTAKPIIEPLFSSTDGNLLTPYLLTGQTLKEIETSLILTVLEQEDYNQSKAAKRLGINRATLYRKIKGHLQEQKSD